MALGKKMIAPLVEPEPRIEYPLYGGLGSGLVSQVPCLGDTVGAVEGKKAASFLSGLTNWWCEWQKATYQ